MMSTTPRRIRKRLATSLATAPQYKYEYGSANVILLKELRTNAPTTPSPTSSPSTVTVPSVAPSAPPTPFPSEMLPTGTPSLAPNTGFPSRSPTQSKGEHLVVFATFAPVWISVQHYSTFLGTVLGLWLFYLLLPKGLRKQFFGAYPKRHRRVRGRHPTVGHWIYPNESKSNIATGGEIPSMGERYRAAEVRKRSRRSLDSREESSFQSRTTPNPNIERQASPTDFGRSSSMQDSSMMSSMFRPSSSLDTPSIMPGRDKYYTGAESSAFSSHARSSYDTESYESLPSKTDKPPPSPIHPSIQKVPNNNILSETMKRLKGRGIRLIAHGVQCEPKRVWLKLDADTYSLSWQTEFPRRMINQSGDASIVLMRGSIHKIALPNVLYIDVGKRTSALLRPDNQTVLDSCCFSLLTQNGSLDLQTSSRLERDALVSCFSVILDQVHDRDWRQMYEEGSSVVSSSVNTSQFASDFVEI